LMPMCRRYHLRTYRNCFVGREAVDWFLQQKSLGLTTRKQAVKFGNRLLKHHHFHHVAFDHPFEDRRLFYRFLQDEDISTKTLNAAQCTIFLPPTLSVTLFPSLHLPASIADNFVALVNVVFL